MKRMKKLLALCLCAAMALGVSACGTKEKSAKEVLEAALEQEPFSSVSAKSVVEMEMVFTMGDVEQSSDVVTTMDMDYFSDPMKMRADMSMEVDGTTVDIAMYACETNGRFMMYTDVGGVWTSQEVELAALEQYDVSGNLGFYLNSSTGLEEAGSEEINGADTFRYTGLITGADMLEAMERTGSLDSLAALEIDEDTFYEMLADMEGMPVTIWIEKESCYPVRCEVDMSALMAGLFEAAAGETPGFNISIPTMVVTMEFFNFDAVEDFEIPVEALAS